MQIPDEIWGLVSLTLWSAADLSIVAGSALAERRDFVKGSAARGLAV